MNTATPFEVLAPDGAAAPIVAHVPHASARIPDDVRAEILLSDEELANELVRLTDWYTDELFGWAGQLGAIRFVNRLSRLVFDPERFLDDQAEPMAARGQGVVYWLDTQGRPLRAPDTQLRRRRIDELYRPYHAALDSVVAQLLGSFGACTVLDCHSFPSLPLPSEIEQAPGRPDICIGTDAFHTPPDLAESMASAFGAEGFRVRRDSPFAGTFVPGGYYGRERRVRSVMVEIRRGLYMDEVTALRHHDFDDVVAAIERAVTNGLGASPVC